jgi:serine/threonine-protein kinase HipA
MRRAEVYRNGILAGILTEDDRHTYTFRYQDGYFFDSKQPAISVTLPKERQEYQSETLFPFFFNMLSEGLNRHLQSLQQKIDEKDDFGFLLATAQSDTIGAVTVKPLSDDND